jgi:hypothetical protein
MRRASVECVDAAKGGFVMSVRCPCYAPKMGAMPRTEPTLEQLAIARAGSDTRRSQLAWDWDVSDPVRLLLVDDPIAEVRMAAAIIARSDATRLAFLADADFGVRCCAVKNMDSATVLRVALETEQHPSVRRDMEARLAELPPSRRDPISGSTDDCGIHLWRMGLDGC